MEPKAICFLGKEGDFTLLISVEFRLLVSDFLNKINLKLIQFVFSHLQNLNVLG